MRFILFTFFSTFGSVAFSQTTNPDIEKQIIRETLSEYLNTNINSVASLIKGNKGYYLMENANELALIIETDSAKKYEIHEQRREFYRYSDSIALALQTKKIHLHISDSLYAYQYTGGSHQLKENKDWEDYYPYLLEDFKENKLHRFDTIIGEAYIDLVRKQIHYYGTNIVLEPSFLNDSYYKFQKSNPCKENDLFCIEADKIYRPVFNADFTMGCYLFSFYCRENEICRSFIFIRKENDKWVYVNEYPSWIIDEG